MRLLFVHADRFGFEATTTAEETVAETEAVPTDGRTEDCVVTFVTVERGDDAEAREVVDRAAGEVRDVAEQLNTRSVVLYPTTHLSDDPAATETAATVLRDLGANLDADLEVLCAPLGWHTAFEMSSKGHPFSMRSRRVGPESGHESAGDSAGSELAVAFPNGEIVDARDAAASDRVGDDLRALIDAEAGADPRENRGNSLPVDQFRELGLAGETDRGGTDALRWYPRGKLVRDLLLERVTDLAVEYGAMPVETPGAGDRRTTGPEGRDGRFSLLADANPSERDLPLTLYEVVDGSPSGGVRRSDRRRNSTTPEIRTAARDAEQAREELRAQAALCVRAVEDLGLSAALTLRTTTGTWDEAWVESLVADIDAPVLLERLPENRRDWSVEVAVTVTDDGAGLALASGVRLDRPAEEFDGERAAGEASSPRMLRSTPVGSVEGALAALLETTAEQETRRLPTWLSPTQVRFVPVGAKHVEHCDDLASDLDLAGVRADVDAREETVGDRIARAESDLVPYYAVVGDREVEDGNPLKVTVRGASGEREMTPDELRATVLDDAGDRPRKRHYLPERVGDTLGFGSR